MDCGKKDDLHRLYQLAGRAAILKTARLVGRVDVAEEIVQSTFLKLWDLRLSFPSERAAYAWIYRACHNAGIDYIRLHATRLEEAWSDEGAETLGANDPFMASVADRQLLRAKIKELSEREAQVLAYQLLDGMTQGEIAEVMGLSRKTIVRLCAGIEAKLAGDPPLAKAQEI